MPESLIVTGIRMLAEYGYIRGGFGHVFNNVVRCSYQSHNVIG